MAVYIGINNVAKKVNKLFIGVNNVAKQVKKIFLGVNNVAKLIYSAEGEKIRFTTSTTWTVPDGISSIDIFCVGGGGGAGGGFYNTIGSFSSDSTYIENYLYGASGGSGYTTTVRNVSVSSGEVLNITVGAGGVGGKTSRSDGTGDTTGKSGTTAGSNGGESFVSRNGVKLASAAGGDGGRKADPTINQLCANGAQGANGGSASGAAGGQSEELVISGGSGVSDYYEIFCQHTDSGAAYVNKYGTNGTDGGDGGTVDKWTGNQATQVWNKIINNVYRGGTGQGSTTREFELSTGTLYSTVATTVSANTGNSGRSSYSGVYSTRNGSSGIVIIKTN